MVSILERVAAGEETAVKECLDRYGALVWSLARRFSGTREDAEDAVQEIFVSLWKSAARFDSGVASETTFVAMVARRRLIDRSRVRASRPDPTSLETVGELPSASASMRVEAAVDLRRAARALEALRPEQRKVVALSVVVGLSHSEIAERTGMPLGTVKTHVRRGLMRVREALAEPAEGDPE